MTIGFFTAAQKSYTEAVTIRRKLANQNENNFAWVLGRLGAAQISLKEYATAQKTYAEALTLRRKLVKQDDADIAWYLDQLGFSQEKAKDLLAAQKSFTEALTLRRKLPDQDMVNIGWTLARLGAVKDSLKVDFREESTQDAIGQRAGVQPPYVTAEFDFVLSQV